MVSFYGDYDDPETVCEWQWVAEKACFRHCGNGVVGGVWEFMVHASADQTDMPESLTSVFSTAKARGCHYILFHQG